MKKISRSKKIDIRNCFNFLYVASFFAIFANSQLAAAKNLTSAPKTWEETRKAALTLNSKPKAKDAEVEAQKELTKSSQDELLPTIHANISLSEEKDNITYNSHQQKYNTNSASGSIDFSWTLFQCGYKYYNYEASKVSEEILQDEFKSTKFFISNTKGNVVANSFESYSSVIKLNDDLDVFPIIKKYLAKLKEVAAGDATSLESIQLAEIEFNNLENTFTQVRESAIENYVHWVTLYPSDKINNLQQAIDELIIPSTPEKAYAIAQQKSPDIKHASDQVRLAELQIKMAQAALCPRVGLTAELSQSYSIEDYFNSSTGTTTGSVGINISVPIFNPSSNDYVNYQKKMLIADKLSQAAALEDAQFSINKIYKDLTNQTKNKQTYEKILSDLLKSINETQKQIDNKSFLIDASTNGSTLDYVNAKLKVISSLTNTWISLADYKANILHDKFEVQQAMGTIF